MRTPGTRSNHSGVTLIELLLALALTSIILVIISMAINLHLRTLDMRRTNVEEAALARAVLRHIATDLRSAVLYDPIDLSGVQSMAEGDPAALLDTVGGVDTGGLDVGDLDTEGLGTGGMDEMVEGDEAETGITENNVDIAGTTAPTSVPGLYGNQYELQVDISRLPRVDQYSTAMFANATGDIPDIPSDVKTVSYFLVSPDMMGLPSVSEEPVTGLMRRSLDRAVTSYSSISGGESGGGQVLAAEVNYLEFRYFDGMAWLTEWDSDEMGGLPIAVEITIAIDPTGGADANEMTVTEISDATYADMTEYMYRLIVRLPVAQPPKLEEEEITDDGLEAIGL